MSVGLRAQAAQLTGRPDQDAMNRLTSTTFFAQLFIAVLIIAGGVTLSLFAPRVFHVRAELRYDASLVLLLLTFGTAINFATQAFSSLLFAHQQIHIDNAIRIAQLAVRTVVTVILLTAGWKVLALAIASLAGVTFFCLLSVFRAYWTVPGLSISRRLGSRAVMWSDFKKMNVWYALGNLAGAAVQSVDRLVAARFISLASVATLALTGRVYALAVLLLLPMTAVAQPAFGQLLGQGNREYAFQTYRRLLVLSTGIAIVFGLSLWSGNAAFVNRWVGAANYGGGALDALMMVNLIIFCWMLPSRMALIVGLHARPQAVTRVVEASLNLALSIILGRKYGLVGIAAATTIAAVATSAWQLPRLAANNFGRSLGEVLRASLKPLAIPLIVTALLAIGIRYSVTVAGGFLGSLVAIGIVCVSGLGLLWLFAFDSEMRARSLRLLRPLRTFGAGS